LLEGFWEAFISRIFIPHNVKRCGPREKNLGQVNREGKYILIKKRKTNKKENEKGKLLFDFFSMRFR